VAAWDARSPALLDGLTDSLTHPRRMEVYVCATLRASLLRQSVTTREENPPPTIQRRRRRVNPTNEEDALGHHCDALDLHFCSMKNALMRALFAPAVRVRRAERAIISLNSYFADWRFAGALQNVPTCAEKETFLRRKHQQQNIMRPSHFKLHAERQTCLRCKFMAIIATGVPFRVTKKELLCT
jgi:hypothetical protein